MGNDYQITEYLLHMDGLFEIMEEFRINGKHWGLGKREISWPVHGMRFSGLLIDDEALVEVRQRVPRASTILGLVAISRIRS